MGEHCNNLVDTGPPNYETCSIKFYQRCKNHLKIMLSNMTDHSNEIDSYESYIYAITMNNHAKSQFYAGYSHINDIIGDEEWMKGDMNNVCNIGSQRKVSLTLGSKKTSKNCCHFEVGDSVLVSYHGIKWDHCAKIMKLNENEETVLSRCNIGGIHCERICN
jgi:hypothetical protein